MENTKIEQKNHHSSKPMKYSKLNVLALAFGCCIGWGCFAMPGTTFLPTAGVIGTVIAMIIGVVIMLLIAENYHYMINSYPDNGGSFTYTKELFGYDHSFFCGWFLWIAYVALIWANATAFILFFRQTPHSLLRFGFHYQIAHYDVYFGEALFCIVILVLFGVMSIYGKQLERILHIFLALILFLGVVSCFILVLAKSSSLGRIDIFSSTKSVSRGIFGIVALAPWAFMGFESASYVAEDYSFSPKKIFRIMAIAIIAAGLCYTLMTLVAVMDHPAEFSNWQDYISALSTQEGVASIPTFFVLNSILGRTGLTMLGITVLAALCTSLIGFYQIAGSLTCTLSENGIFPLFFSKKDQFGKPKNAIIAIMLISLPIPFIGRTSISWLTDVTTISAAIAYGYTAAATLVTARRLQDIFHEVTGALGLLFSLLFALFPLIPKSISSSGHLAQESYLILGIWSIIGFIHLRFVFKQDTGSRMKKSSVIWMAMLFLIFFSSLMWVQQMVSNNAQAAVNHISQMYTQEIEEQGGFKQRAEYSKREKEFLTERMEKIEDTLQRNTLIQMLIIMLALYLMFSIYSQIRQRESKMEAEMIAAIEKNQAKSTFLTNISHDIRTPMNAIIGFTTLARKEPNMPPQIGEYLTKIESSSQHLLALINDVLEMSRIESGEMGLELTEIDLSRAIDEVRDMFQTQMESKHITYTVEMSNVKNKIVLCDKNRLNRVLLNLLSNAYKFTPEGGAVSVHLCQTGIEGQIGSYEIRVKDTGIGMSPEFAAKVFEAYEREKTVSGIQGTGLGMAITKNIIDLMNGVITVNTEQGKGSEFVIQIDLTVIEVEADTEHAEEHTNKDIAVDFSTKKLLLVEDIELNREIATMLLEEVGFTLDTAENGQIAVEKVKASKPGDYDAILMDIQMPVMNGYEATRAIRALDDPALSSIPIAAMTANAFAEDIQAAQDAGMNAHIAKPINVAEMMATLTELLR